MLGYVYEFILTYIWQPIFDESGILNTLTIGGNLIDTAEWLTTITCIIIGGLIIWLLIMLVIKVFKWFSGMIGD